jgi:hypothetical protein
VAMNSKRLLLISTAETKLKIQTPIFDSIDKYRKAGNQKEKTAINKIKGFHPEKSHFLITNRTVHHLEKPNIVKNSRSI